MELKRGDLVTRISYNHDTVFKITNIKNDIYYLKGTEVRLYADAEISDLVKYKETEITKKEETFEEEIPLDRTEYFYIPGTILHIDGDKEYLDKCLNYYKKKRNICYRKKNKRRTHIREYFKSTKWV